MSLFIQDCERPTGASVGHMEPYCTRGIGRTRDGERERGRSVERLLEISVETAVKISVERLVERSVEISVEIGRRDR